MPFRSSFSEALPPLPSPVVGHFIFPFLTPESLISPLLNQATSNSSVVCFGLPLRHYGRTDEAKSENVPTNESSREGRRPIRGYSRRIHLSGIRYTWTFVISRKWALIPFFTRTILVTLIFSGHQHICLDFLEMTQFSKNSLCVYWHIVFQNHNISLQKWLMGNHNN